MDELIQNQLIDEVVLPPKLIIIEGYTNFLIINAIKYFSVIVCVALLINIIFNKIKHKKTNKIIIIFFIISLVITFLAFFTGIYDEIMRTILPYYYGV